MFMPRGGCGLLRYLLGSIFILSGFEEFFAIESFSERVTAYQIVPEALGNIVAIILPAFEIVGGTLLVVNILGRIGSLMIIVLLTVFCLALGSVIFRGLHVNCECFGSLPWLEMEPKPALARDLTMLALACMLYQGLLHKPS